jgi:hypothetical protein
MLLIVVGCTTAAIDPTPTADPAPTVSPMPTPTDRPTPSPSPSPSAAPTPEVAFGDGTHRVPEDVAPGTYRTTTFTTNCYWTRLRGFESGLKDIIASRIGSGFQVVTIGRRDRGFDATSCGDWTADLSAVVGTRTEFGDGTYIVGTDIAPGRYTADEGTGCEWARLRGFGGTRRQVIDRAIVDDGEPPVIKIKPTDVGFTSSGCGMWRALDSGSDN